MSKIKTNISAIADGLMEIRREKEKQQPKPVRKSWKSFDFDHFFTVKLN